MIFVRASISIKGYNIVKLMKIQKSEEDEPQSLFSQLKQQTLLFVFLLMITILTNLNNFIIVFYI